MTKRGFLAVLAFSLLTAAAPAFAQCSSPYFIDQAFPTGGPEVTRWRLCWQVVNGPNLVITGAWFRPKPDAEWIKVLHDGRLSQLFVVYHPGWPRYRDVNYGFTYVPLTTADCKHPAVILGKSEVCKAVRDRGLMWKHKLNQRRGEELSLFSVLAAENYDYIVEWIFRDDGVFGARLGMTGIIFDQNAHMHGSIWRLDMDLNGPCCDTASIMSHEEVGATGVDSMTDINQTAGFPWDPLAYDMLTVRDANLKNAKGKSTEIHLMPFRMGTPLHQEDFTQNTYWVTAFDWSQTLADDLPLYVSWKTPILNADIVLWYYTGAHHMIRDEDRTSAGTQGMTLVMQDQFQLKPFNLWGQTPFCEPPFQCN